jgi:hypothetical protein
VAYLQQDTAFEARIKGRSCSVCLPRLRNVTRAISFYEKWWLLMALWWSDAIHRQRGRVTERRRDSIKMKQIFFAIGI